ncbi:hypothetical protein [Chlorobium phaeobacteroides]|nr:hypothetical protein [Chlorobium phaeobacteroides]
MKRLPKKTVECTLCKMPETKNAELLSAATRKIMDAMEENFLSQAVR